MVVLDVVLAAERLWPTSGKQEWDAVGLISGDLDAPVDSVLLAVDAVSDTVTEALDRQVDMLIVHHPLLLRGVTTVSTDRYKGAALAGLIRGHCALLAAHTNADVMETGPSGILAGKLGLMDVRPIHSSAVPGRGIGRVGRLPAETTLGRLGRRLGEILPATASGIRVSGDFDQPVTTVALCAGAGDAYLSAPEVVSADVYITSDLRHHPASEARENSRNGRGPALIDVSHWAAEWLWLTVAASELRTELPGIDIRVSELRTDPWDFAIMQ